jgi:hypothetical protein
VRDVPTTRATALAVLVHARTRYRYTWVDTIHTDTILRHELLACVKAHVLIATCNCGTSPDVDFMESAPTAPAQDQADCDALCFGVLERNAERRACK